MERHNGLTSLSTTLAEVAPQVSEVIHDMVERTSDYASQATKKAISTAKQGVEMVDKTAHRRPWTFVGGAALAGGVIGYFLARKSR